MIGTSLRWFKNIVHIWTIEQCKFPSDLCFLILRRKWNFIQSVLLFGLSLCFYIFWSLLINVRVLVFAKIEFVDKKTQWKLPCHKIDTFSQPARHMAIYSTIYQTMPFIQNLNLSIYKLNSNWKLSQNNSSKYCERVIRN